MADRLDVAERLAEGRPAVEHTQSYVQACHVLGYEHPDLTAHPSQIRDWYDSDYYRAAPDHDPPGPSEGEQKVLRGGSWSDCAEVVTVTFRMSRHSRNWRQDSDGFGGHMTPNIGFRLCRVAGQRTSSA